MTQATTPLATEQLAQARLFAEVARRVEHPIDALPRADTAAVALLLWQQAAACAVAAAEATDIPDAGRLLRAAGSAELLEAVQAALKKPPAYMPGEQAASAARARSLAVFASRLIDDLNAVERTRQQRRWERVAHYALVAILPLVALLGVMIWVIRGPNLVPTSSMTLSSEYSPSCDKGGCGTATFSTNQESSPWVKYDFGKVRKLRSIVVDNRTDCCWDRALPLIVEASSDGTKWTELVRTERPFLHFSHPLKAEGRYVRLRVGTKSYLHLQKVTIR